MFECGSIEELIKQCAKNKKKHYKKNKKKQAMVARWSDSEGSSIDGEEDNSKEVLVFLNSCPKDELVKALFDMFPIEPILKDKKKMLEDRIYHYAEGIKFEEFVKVLKEQSISQTKQLIELQNKNYDLEAELKTLRYESEKNLQSLST